MFVVNYKNRTKWKMGIWSALKFSVNVNRTEQLAAKENLRVDRIRLSVCFPGGEMMVNHLLLPRGEQTV